MSNAANSLFSTVQREHCPDGGTGRHVRLRGVWRNPCRFKSGSGHISIHSAKKLSIAIVGTGPASLVAATLLARHGHHISIFEKKKAPATKLILAGQSGLNVSNTCAKKDFLEKYDAPKDLIRNILENFSRQDWLDFLSKLGFPTFSGSGGKIFIKGLKTPPLLRRWLGELKNLGVRIYFQHELVDFKSNEKVMLTFSSGKKITCDAALMGLGGASWEREIPLRWPEIFRQKKINLCEFTPANCGYHVAWPKKFLLECEGKPLKNICLTTPKGQQKGELIITAYGLEGGPIYHLGMSGPAKIDLKPDLTEKQIVQKLARTKENQTPLRRIKKYLALGDVSLALIFHMGKMSPLESLENIAHLIKNFPISLGKPADLKNAISSAGGICLDEVTPNLELIKFKNIYVMGEMLDWSAPTGGFLIQACASMGATVAKHLLKHSLNTMSQCHSISK